MTADLSKIKLLLLDVDGVMTDGRIIYGRDGSETKAFDVKDGHGLKLLQRVGIRVGIITGQDPMCPWSIRWIHAYRCTCGRLQHRRAKSACTPRIFDSMSDSTRSVYRLFS